MPSHPNDVLIYKLQDSFFRLNQYHGEAAETAAVRDVLHYGIQRIAQEIKSAPGVRTKSAGEQQKLLVAVLGIPFVETLKTLPKTAVTTKAAPAPQPDPVDAAALQLAAALKATMGNTEVLKWFQEQIRSASGAKPPAGQGKIRDSQKPATKAQNINPTGTTMIDDFGRPLARFVRDEHGRPLK